MNKYAIVRILGNELPPRDTKGNRIKSLQFILDNEQRLDNCTKFWIINQVHSDELKSDYLSLLEKERTFLLNFDRKKYIQSRTFREKLIHGININKARNYSFEIAKGHEFIFVLDGDCLFTKELWNQTIKEIEEDQKVSNRKYYGVPAIRSVNEIPKDVFKERMYEPMNVFRHDAELKFNEEIPFSESERLEFMYKVGYSSKEGVTTLEGDLCRDVGCLVHISFNEPKSESDMYYRMDLRQKAIELLVENLDKKHRRLMLL